MTSDEYKICSRCVHDTSDPEITFDADGVCNHCQKFDDSISKQWHPDAKGATMLAEKIHQIKQEGKNQRFDSILGLSGGLDSSYLAVKLKEFGLRPLLVHVDAGWNSELAVHNIDRIISYCGFELYTKVLDWREVRDLQLAYLKSGVANQDVVQDHGFFAALYNFANRENIKYVFNGGNIATESVFPNAWHHAAMDAINLKAIHRKYGSIPLKDFETVSFFKYYIYYPFIKRMEVIRPLNFMPYSKQLALDYLKREVGYKEYGRKHGESLFTRFFQNYFLPTRFGYDKRRPHLSSLILSGQITRDEALQALQEPLYDEDEFHQDRAFVARKLEISVDELEGYIHMPLSHYSDYENWDKYYNALKSAQRIRSRIMGNSGNVYS